MNDAVATINEVMKVLSPSALTYEEWLQIGMALHAEGGSCLDWEAWSRNDSRFVSGECEKKWAGFGRHGQSEIKCGSIVELARRHGFDVSPKHIEDDEPDAPLDWNSPIEDVKAQRVIRPEYVIPAIIKQKENWDPIDDLVRYIRAVFQQGEKFSVCLTAKKDEREDGSIRFHPSSSGNVFDVDKTLESLGRQAALKDEGDITNVLGPYNKDAGGWVRINPVIGDEGDDRSVSAWRHALVECDRKTPEEQLAIIREMNLPCAAIIHSGGHSVHAIVKIDAETRGEYQRRVDFLFDMCEKNGLPLDKQNRNPSRYSRLPGIVRGENRQFLIDVNCGAKTWQDWKDWVEEQNDDLPDIESADDWLDNPPALSDEIIEGVLRKGRKMLLSGPSKAGKSELLMELAIAVCEGSEWLGMKCHAGRVLYVNLELDETYCKHRIHDLYSFTGRLASRCKGNLDVWNLRGKALPFDKLAPKLVRRCKTKGYSLIIIDPIYKVITGDENDAHEMGKFCNLFDSIATTCNCSTVYCHHHSKGAQGGKNAMDRASGSGVFARDPDALLDMIQLSVDKVRFAEICERIACNKVAESMDRQNPSWRGVCPQDDAVVWDKLRAFATERGYDWQTVYDDISKRFRSATAWRLTFTLREFAAPDPVNFFFAWPVHEIDTTGMLEDVTEDGAKPLPKAKPDKVDEEQAKLMKLQMAVKDVRERDGDITVEAVAKEMGMKPESIIYNIKRHGKKLDMHISKGIIYED